MKHPLLAAIGFLALSACSNQAMYNSIQISQEEECRKLPPGQQEQCFARIDTDYGEYERQRQEVLAE